MKSNIILILCLFVALTTINITYLSAQSVKGTIFYQDQDPKEQKIINENGVTFLSMKNLARVVTEDASSPFHQTTGVCQIWSVPVGEGNDFSHGVCMMANKEGDTYIVYSTNYGNDAGEVDVYTKGGTGVFKNLNAQGKASKLMPAHTKKEGDCCMQTWIMKYL